MYEAQFFARRKANPAALRRYGFEEGAGGWRWAAPMLDGQFRLEVCVPGEGLPATRLIDAQTGEEYALHKVESATGAFVGAVRAACGAALTEIARRCFEPDVFRAAQTLALIDRVRARYGDEPEYLWEKLPDNAVWRRADNRKWYGVILTVDRRKLGLDAAGTAEVIDLRLPPEEMAATVDGKRYFPGWHMNKKNWYTIPLDGSVPTEELCRRIGVSYDLAGKQR